MLQVCCMYVACMLHICCMYMAPKHDPSSASHAAACLRVEPTSRPLPPCRSHWHPESDSTCMHERRGVAWRGVAWLAWRPPTRLGGFGVVRSDRWRRRFAPFAGEQQPAATDTPPHRSPIHLVPSIFHILAVQLGILRRAHLKITNNIGEPT